MTNKNSVFHALLTAFFFSTALWASDNQILDEYIVLKANHSTSDEMTLPIGKRPLKMLKVTQDNMPSLYQMVHSLATKLKITIPAILVYEGNGTVNGWNAFAISLYHNLGTIAIGLDLIKNLLPAELEAVIAHELGHVSDNHSVKTLGARALLSRPPALKPFFEQGTDGLLHGLLLSALSRHHERQADRSAAGIVDDSESLARALDKIEKMTGVQEKKRKKSRSQKMLDFAKSFFLSHPSTTERKKHLVSRVGKKEKS